MIKKWIQQTGWRRIILMVIGNLILGMGISIFKLASLGNDSFSGMTMAISASIHMNYGTYFLLQSAVLFVIEVIFGRQLIGIGTVVNACFLGYFTMFFSWIWEVAGLQIQGLGSQLITLVIAVLIQSFGLSLYQSSDAGISPYDSLALILTERFPKVPYFFNRVLLDGICAVICWRFGGLIGIGMLVAMFGLGPVISIFNKCISEKLVGER